MILYPLACRYHHQCLSLYGNFLLVLGAARMLNDFQLALSFLISKREIYFQLALLSKRLPFHQVL